MRTDDSPATRRMLRIMEPAPVRAGQPWTATSPEAEPEWADEAVAGWPDQTVAERPADPAGAGVIMAAGLPGPRLAIDRRAALAAGLLVLLGLLVCGWLILRPGPSAHQVPPRALVTTGGTGSVPGVSGVAVPAVAGPPITGAPGAAASPAGPAGLAQGAGISVYVVGAVRHPGVVQLAAGTRVVDAVEAAGGATSRADLTGVNLARKITDGEQILVPKPGQVAGTAVGGTGSSALSGGTPGGAAPALNLNTATEAQFEELPGVGPVMAGRIVAWRQQNGQFTRVDQLGEVSGIGDVTLQKLRPLVTV